MFPRFPIAAHCLGIMALSVVAGCISGREESADVQNLLPTNTRVANAVTVEIVYLHVAPEERERLASLWAEVDEQIVSADTRRRLDDNGMRCGVMGSLMPSDLRYLLDHGPGSTGNENNSVAEASAAAPSARAIQLRPGRRGEVIAGGEREQIELLFVDDMGQLQGESLQRAQSLFAAKASSQADGRITVQLTPEVHFGDPRQRYVGRGGAFRIDSSRERRIFEDLNITSHLSPGETLIVGGSADSKGLGKLFFTGEAPDGGEQRVLLIRLAQSQPDDRFDLVPEGQSEPLPNNQTPLSPEDRILQLEPDPIVANPSR